VKAFTRAVKNSTVPEELLIKAPALIERALTTTLAKVGGISEERRIEKLPASLILFNKLLYAGKCEAT